MPVVKETTEEVLDSAFGGKSAFQMDDLVALQDSPSYGEIHGFAQVIADEPSEEEIHAFISKNSRLLRSMFGFADDSVLAIVSKPKIGNKYIADFGVLWFGQGGCVYSLIELEPVTARIFTKKLSPALRYQGAITQVSDWAEWIDRNKTTFIADAIAHAKSLPLMPNATANGSFRTRDGSYIDNVWRGFGGYDDPAVTYSIVIGRWSRLSDSEKRRLLSVNKNNKLYATLTYDQMIRRGIARRFMTW